MTPRFRAWNSETKEIEVFNTYEEISELFSALSADDGFYSIMQSTGLFDKNGKEIFEGDILKNNKYITSVFYEKGAYCVKFRRTTNTTVIMNVISFIEKYKTKVIGNIYENPEFVKDKEVDN